MVFESVLVQGTKIFKNIMAMILFNLTAVSIKRQNSK